ncbi:MAG: hypothetical protein WCP82_10780 [Alphaproteobacteria bacterium]
MEKAPSTGKTTAIAGMAGTQAVTLLLYVVHCFGINDMTPEVASAIIGLSITLAGAVMHILQRRQEKRTFDNEEPNGVTGGPGAAPLAGA